MKIKQENIADYLSQILHGELDFSIDSLDQFETDLDKELAYGLVCLSEDLEFYKNNTNIEINNLKKSLFSSSAVVITDAEGRIKSCNTNFEQLSGYNSKELITNSLKIINSSYHDKRFFQEMWQTINDGNIWKGDFRNQNKNGTIFWVSTYIFPIKDIAGNIKEFWSINHDITDKVCAEKALLKKNMELEEAKRLSVIGEFAAGIAHEVNNPLAIISGKTQLLDLQLKQLLPNDTENFEKIKASIDVIVQTVSHTADLIKNLKSFSHKADFENQEYHPLENAVNMVLKISQSRSYYEGTEIKVKILPGLNILCNLVGLSQVLLNLILNSISAIQNLKEKWIEIEATVTDSVLKISITDSGKGISDDIKHKITQPFFTTKDPGEGTGLGLSISVKAMERMKGKLYYNDEHENTQFIIETKHFLINKGHPSHQITSV